MGDLGFAARPDPFLQVAEEIPDRQAMEAYAQEPDCFEWARMGI
jgi:hypothetical protein